MEELEAVLLSQVRCESISVIRSRDYMVGESSQKENTEKPKGSCRSM